MKKSNKDNKQEFPISSKEFDLAWKEFFKNKLCPKTDKEEKKQLEEFTEWYNNVRKQSDTGKTPNEMYKEVYGKEPKNPTEISRITNFEWDEDYKEPDELLHEADYLISVGKYKEALKIADECLKMIPNDEEILLMKAEILNNLDEYEKAEMILKKMDKIESAKAFASFYRSQRYFYEGNFIRAIQHMKEAYEQEPETFDFIIGLANHLSLTKDKYYNEYVEKARKIDKKRTEKFLKKFWIEQKELARGQFVLSALECINKLMGEDKVEEAEKNISFLLLHENYLVKEAVKTIRGLQIECLLMKNLFYDAEIKINELIAIDKNNPHAFLYKASLFYNQSKLNEALVEIDKCLKIAEKTIPHPDFYRLKAMILKEQDNDDYIYYENKANELAKGQKVLIDFMESLKDEGEDFEGN